MQVGQCQVLAWQLVLPVEDGVVQLAAARDLAALKRRTVDVDLLLADGRQGAPPHELAAAAAALTDEHVAVQLRQLRPVQTRLEVQSVDVLRPKNEKKPRKKKTQSPFVQCNRFGAVPYGKRAANT